MKVIAGSAGADWAGGQKALSPRGLREKRFSAVLSWRCASWLVFRDARGAAGRDVRPAAQFLSFAPPKERNQRKGGPAACDPDAAHRGSRGARPRGGAAELAARQAAPLKQPRRISLRSGCVLRLTRLPRGLRALAQAEGVGNRSPSVVALFTCKLIAASACPAMARGKKGLKS